MNDMALNIKHNEHANHYHLRLGGLTEMSLL